MKEKDQNRKGYEFTLYQKQRARNEAQGKCQFPGYECEKPANNRVGHFTGIADGRSRGVVRESIVCDDNRIVQCNDHDKYLDDLQKDALEDQRKGESWPPLEVVVFISPD